MSVNSRLKTLFAVGLIVFGASNALQAQKLIQLDSDQCADGLKALSNMIETEIKAAIPARKILGKCTAQKLRLKTKSQGVEIEIERLEWDVGSLSPLETGDMPAVFNLSIKRARVTGANPGDPIWSYLAGRTNGTQNMDARLGFGYSADDRKLVLHQAFIDFQNDNRINLRVSADSVSARLPGNPAFTAAGIVVNDFSLTITSGVAAPNPILAMIQNALKKDIGDRDFKPNLLKLVSLELSKVLAPADLADLKRLIIDAPRAKGDIALQLQSTNGYALAQLALIKSGDRLADILKGFDVKFAYGARAN